MFKTRSPFGIELFSIIFIAFIIGVLLLAITLFQACTCDGVDIRGKDINYISYHGPDVIELDSDPEPMYVFTDAPKHTLDGSTWVSLSDNTGVIDFINTDGERDTNVNWLDYPPDLETIEDATLRKFLKDNKSWVENYTTIGLVGMNQGTAQVNIKLRLDVIVMFEEKAPGSGPPTIRINASSSDSTSFEVTDLVVKEPRTVNPEDQVRIDVTVKNNGGVMGTYTINLLVKDIIETTREVTLDADASITESFNVSRNEPGTYNVSAGGKQGQFIVRGPSSIVNPPQCILVDGKVVFSDTTFNDASWERIDLIPVTGTTASDLQSLLEANSYRKHTMILPPTTVGQQASQTASYEYKAGSYDPKICGAIKSIDFSLKAMLQETNVTGGSQGIGFVVFQNGVTYSRDATSFSLINQWETRSLTGLVATSFTYNGQHPDFSVGGAPITFGYKYSGSKASLRQVTVVFGVDDWEVKITPGP